MAQQAYITLEEFSRFHRIEGAVLREFVDYGLVQVHLVEEKECLQAADLERAERLVRLHHDLGINPEGLDIILHLREQLIALQAEREALAHRLRKLEQERQPSRGASGYIVDIEFVDL